ncbi:MAG: DUF115 domain-containing protein [Phycisphaerales bacterium]|nr:DUF115 domain-containing protein [Planctomycetota bacterium]MCH8507959.1 DUF115 domain-containing protein [Phycisphaerales bacterium]
MSSDPNPFSQANPFDLTTPIDQLGGDGPGGLAPEPPRGIPADAKVFERNLIALSARNRPLADRLRRTPGRTGLVLEHGQDGLVTATLDGRRLSSPRRGADEARRLAESIEPTETAAACINGFALGHHVRAIHERMGTKSVVICFEPDLGLLRSVLERVDHSAWMAMGRCIIATDPDDAAGLSRSLQNFEGLLAIGVKIIDHPASTPRLGEASARFGRTMSEVVRSTRTHVVTTLVHAPVTLRNMLMNADHYAACAGITALKDACKGFPAVTVAAGPSLQKNLALLAEPGVRDRVVIIAAQTVLKPMLEAGIRPHFVTALDHHELSGRFYEGLTAENVRGVRLVVEPKANPAILESFPGEILCTQETVLDDLIGPELVREMGRVKPGATVAHLSYALARYIGCDPVIMIGQDLAFTDGQYYAAGAAIHRVWQGELNPERTLEMLEWERVARMRANLRPVTDQQGRRIYTDEQMATYLAQFESDFQADTQAGLTIIDATEGGAAKRHSTAMTLRDALDRFATRERPVLPETRHEARDHQSVHAKLWAHLDKVRGQAKEIARQSRRAERTLGQVRDSLHDDRRADALIQDVYKMRDIVFAQQPGFRLTEFINQTGVLNRFKADRVIGLHDGKDSLEHRRLHAERDIKNVGWIGDAADELGRRINDAIGVLEGRRAKLTRDEAAPDAEPAADGPRVNNPELFVLCDPDYSGLGTRRDLAEPVWDGRDALSLTLARVLRCRSVRRVRVLTPEPERTRALIERAGFQGRVTIEPVDRGRWRERARAIGVARAGAAACYRGGIAQATTFDEQLDPRIVLEVMDRHGVDACAIVGADWCLTDPALLDAMMDRHRAEPERQQIVFTQAAPGLAGCVLGRSAMESIVAMQDAGSPLATVGGVLGYVPVRPQADPIATPLCVKVDPCVRDLGLRAIADSMPGWALIAGAMDRLGDHATDASAVQAARALEASRPFRTARTLVLELCPGRLASSDFGAWKRGGPIPGDRAAIDLRRAHDLIREHTRHREDAVVVLDGPGDPLMHPHVLDIIELADEAGAACVHLRTDLLHDTIDADRLAESGLGVLSVDLLATDARTYAALTGLDRYDAVLKRMGAIADARSPLSCGLPTPWVLPRMTKCDATLEQVESFYDRWTMTLGGAVIDPLPSWFEDRIRPLPVPGERLTAIESDIVRVRCDGMVCDHRWRNYGLDAFQHGLIDAARLVRKRLGVARPKPAPAAAGTAA